MSEVSHRGGPGPVVRAAIGPRRPRGIYRNGYLNLEYRVEEILTGEAARVEIPYAEFAIAQIDLTGATPGRRRVHCTAWNPRRDEVLHDPEVGPRQIRLLKP